MGVTNVCFSSATLNDKICNHIICFLKTNIVTSCTITQPRHICTTSTFENEEEHALILLNDTLNIWFSVTSKFCPPIHWLQDNGHGLMLNNVWHVSNVFWCRFFKHRRIYDWFLDQCDRDMWQEKLKVRFDLAHGYLWCTSNVVAPAAKMEFFGVLVRHKWGCHVELGTSLSKPLLGYLHEVQHSLAIGLTLEILSTSSSLSWPYKTRLLPL